MFRPRVRIPNNAPIFPYWDVQLIDGQTDELDFFKPGPDKEDTNNNYINNPLPTENHTVILAMHIVPTTLELKTATNIDPAQVVNALGDAVIEIKKNRERDQALEAPISSFMDLQDKKVSNYHNGTDFEQTITLSAGKPRHLDNLFALKSGTSWSLSIKFADGAFPAQSDFTNAGLGRFGLKPVLTVVELDDDELAEYERRLEKAANGK